MTIRNRDQKHKLRTKWEQLSGNRKVQETKEEAHNKQKRKLDSTRGADTPASLKLRKTSHREEAALQQGNLKWTGKNELLSAQESIRLDAQDRLDNDAAAWMMIVRTVWQCMRLLSDNPVSCHSHCRTISSGDACEVGICSVFVA
jgi:hypothetical protein